MADETMAQEKAPAEAADAVIAKLGERLRKEAQDHRDSRCSAPRHRARLFDEAAGVICALTAARDQLAAELDAFKCCNDIGRPQDGFREMVWRDAAAFYEEECNLVSRETHSAALVSAFYAGATWWQGNGWTERSALGGAAEAYAAEVLKGEAA